MLAHETKNKNPELRPNIVTKAPESKTDSVPSPFIALFEAGIVSGLFKNLGDIEQLKKENQDFSTVIDQWVSEAIFNNEIKIETDGIIKCNHAKVINYGLNKTVEPIVNTVTKLAVNQSLKKENPYSTINFYGIEDHPESIKEYKQIVGEFLTKIEKLCLKTFNSSSDKMYYAALSTCTLNKKLYNEI